MLAAADPDADAMAAAAATPPAPGVPVAPVRLYLLLAKDDDSTPRLTHVYATSEAAAIRYIIRQGVVEGEVLLGIGDHEEAQSQYGCPPPAKGLTPGEIGAYLAAMTPDIFKKRLQASYPAHVATARQGYMYVWMGEVTPMHADE